MKIRKFRATDSQAAMRQIRAELGADAAILACYDVPEGIEFLVTLEDVSIEPAAPLRATTAAAHQEHAVSRALAARRGVDALVSPQAMRAAAIPLARQPAVAGSPVRHAVAAPVEAHDTAPDGELVSLRAELGNMRSLLETHLRTVVQGPASPSASFSGDLMQALRTAPSAEAADAALPLSERLAAALPVRTLPESGITAFVGTAGVGKTSLLARVATQLVMAGQGRDVAIICTDANRLGAAEQLKAYARVLQVPVHVAHDAASLGYLLGMLQSCRHVLIDTAGISSRDRDGLASLQDMLAVCPQADIILTLPADADAAVQEGMADLFASLMPTGLALTRLDEARRLDGAMTLAVRHRLPLTWTSEDANLPHAVRHADADTLAERACRLAGIPLEGDDGQESHGAHATRLRA